MNNYFFTHLSIYDFVVDILEPRCISLVDRTALYPALHAQLPLATAIELAGQGEHVEIDVEYEVIDPFFFAYEAQFVA